MGLPGIFFSAPAGKRVAFVLMALTCFQAAFLTPDAPLVPGERTNLATGLLCGMSLVGAWLFTDGLEQRLHSRAAKVSAALLLLGGLSILFCPFPAEQGSAFFRGSVALASGLGGYWCGRILLRERPWREMLAWYLAAVLVGLICFCIAGYVIKDEIQDLLPGSGKHPLINRIMLLWFAPLMLMAMRERFRMFLGGALIAFSYVALYLSRLRTAVLMPLVLGGASVLLGLLPWRWTVLLSTFFLLVAASFFALFPEKFQEITRSDREEVYYRVENYPFSWHVATKHPWLGIGLRTDRARFLQDYEPVWPSVSKQRFRESVEKIVTSENSYTTLMVGFGIPFALLYTGALLWIYCTLGLSVARVHTADVPPLLALFLPLTASLTYFMVYDGLMYPQVSWFFHLLLGMAPSHPLKADASFNSARDS